jgi:very-short-patch-repair endonuclease
MRRAHDRQRERELRAAPTDAEQLLWHHLRDRRLQGHKFRRQKCIGPWFVDFACIESHLVVELDGGQHVVRAHADEQRTRDLRERGFRVIRFWNDDVLLRTDHVLTAILVALGEDSVDH